MKDLVDNYFEFERVCGEYVTGLPYNNASLSSIERINEETVRIFFSYPSSGCSCCSIDESVDVKIEEIFNQKQ